MNIDYIITIPLPFENRTIEIYTGCLNKGVLTGTEYFTLTKETFDNLIKELGLKEV